MSGSRHTPGPWEWVDWRSEGGWSGAAALPELFGANNESVLWLGSNFPHDNTCGEEPSPADAALIAAAPELLEALKEIERANTWCMHVKCMEPIGRLTDIARAAIARAEGREP